MATKYARSSDCRYRFIKNHPGFHGLYMCAYCGKIIPQSKMQVDHIVPVNRVKHFSIGSLITRQQFNTEDGINHIDNLVAACGHCNESKGSRTGLWVLRGRFGWLIQPLAWLISLSVLIYVVYWLIAHGGLSHTEAQDLISQFINHLQTLIIGGIKQWFRTL